MALMTSEYPVEFGRYRLLRKLARGGMAEIFLASNPEYPCPVVIKRVLPHFHEETEFLKMFINEARIAAHLHHPGIVQILDLGQHEGQLFLAMEYIDGHDVGRLAKVAGSRMPPFVAARIGADLCDALFYANQVCDRHGKPLQVIHRDVTPGNVMVDRLGMVKLVDFGVAKAEAQLDKTRPGVVKGKFRYMSPEQIDLRPLDGRSDLFSLGVLLYEITTGQMPFDRAQIIDIAFAITSWDPPPPTQLIPDFPQSISEVIMKSLHKDRNQRYASGQEMKLALENAITVSGNSTSTSDVGRFVSKLEQTSLKELLSSEEEFSNTANKHFERKENRHKFDRGDETIDTGNAKELQLTRRIRRPSLSEMRKSSDSAPPLKSELLVNTLEERKDKYTLEDTDRTSRIETNSRPPSKAPPKNVSDFSIQTEKPKNKSHRLLLVTAFMLLLAVIVVVTWFYFLWRA